MTINHERYRRGEGRILVAFTFVGVVAGGLLEIHYLDTAGRMGATFGGLAGFVIGFIFLFIRNMAVMKFPKH